MAGACPYCEGGMPDIAPYMGNPGRNVCAVLALVFGIVSLFAVAFTIAGVAFGAAAVILGAFGYSSEKRGIAVVGIVLGALGIIAAIFVFVSAVLMIQINGFLTEIQQKYNLTEI